MATKEELEQCKKEIEDCLREGLKNTVGTPLDIENVKRELTKALVAMETEAEYPPAILKYAAAASELLQTVFLGMPEKFDPHTLLRALPTHFLVMLRESFGQAHGFPLNIIWLEILHRQGDLIGDWSFERRSSTEAKLNFQLKKPLDYIALNLAVNGEEKKN